jgi:hypothetical protein
MSLLEKILSGIKRKNRNPQEPACFWSPTSPWVKGVKVEREKGKG